MTLAFCFWGISSGSAVEGAWLHLMNILERQNGYVGERLMEGGFRVLRSDIRRLRRSEVVVCANIWQVCICRLLTLGSGTRIVFWVQGLVAEESRLRHQSKLRYRILLLIEYISFRFSAAYIYVSAYMSEFYASRYSWSSSRTSMIVPCVSELSPAPDVVRLSNAYCYVGGMSPWQRFEDVVRIMNFVLENQPDATFNVATRDVDACYLALDRRGSERLRERVTVCSLLNREDIRSFLSSHEFGFLMREDIDVNHVSSPIKLAEYLSCGLSVIGTTAVKSYIPVLEAAGHIVELAELNHPVKTFVFAYRGEAIALEMYRRFFSPDIVTARVDEFLHQLAIRR